MPAIKGDMYINTHCNYSQPTLIKLYNENIGGHLTPLQWHYSKALVRFPIRLLQQLWLYLSPFSKRNDILVEKRQFFIPPSI